ncbi:MAG: C10 family peptidase [Bacteroidota bacterium]
MRRLILLAAVCITAIFSVSAQTVSIDKARQVAKNMYFERASMQGQVNAKDISVVSEYTISQNFMPVYYVFNIGNNKGFVIVSADERTVPVLSYAFEGTYSNYNQPENFVSWMNNYKLQIAYARDNNIAQSEEATALWNRYAAETIELSKGTNAVTPLLGAIAWDQGCYYNEKCPTAPMYGMCTRYPTGCVATAMAMIMKYHGWPAHGYGTHSYVHTIANGYPNNCGTLAAPCGTTNYAWSSMPSELTSSSSTTQKNAVATLIYHCGVTINTSYDTDGSGAFVADCQEALTYHFIYNASYESKFSYTDAAWKAKIKANLDAARPILYAGSDPSGTSAGHCFVLDGYQGSGNDYFHFNWGWSGMYNSYNYLSAITPGGVGTGGGNGDFTYDQQAVMDIYPANPSVPVANFTANKTNIVTGDFVNFTNSSTGGLDYLWTVTPNTGLTWMSATTPTSVSPRIKFGTAGNYTVVLKATNSAGSNTKTRSSYIHVSGGSGIEDASISAQITIGPNPSTGSFMINTGAIDAMHLKVDVYNLIGQKQSGYSCAATGNSSLRADLTGLASGIYCIVFTCSEGSASKKVQIIR